MRSGACTALKRAVPHPSGELTADSRHCREKGSAYAATRFCQHCHCGNSYGKYGPAKNCDAKCSGNQAEICGGTWANSVYGIK
ncbi:MAG: WSC domain-containing protein [Syntrophales bacterium]|nr:WSC domain-containing protein [Syntrophales bacterium]